MIYLDFETRSQADLKTCGSVAYAEHPSTQVLCACWAIDDGPVSLWHKGYSWIEESEKPVSLLEAVKARHLIESHNASFERAVMMNLWWYPFVVRSAHHWRCSAAKAASFALPRSLDGAAEALRLSERKDARGRTLIQLLSKPQKDGTYNEDEDPTRMLWEYCAQDVVTERAVSKALRPLHPQEQKLWEADCRMNERGIPVDIVFAGHALRLVDEERKMLNEDLERLTHGEVERGTQRARFVKWASSKGVELPNTQASTVSDLLKGGSLPSDVADGLEILKTVNMTSVAKFKAAIKGASGTWPDERLRNTQIFHGANTGRWTGKGIQPHNLPRGLSPAQCAVVALDAKSGLDAETFDILHGSPTKVLSSAVRGLFVASKDMHLFVADYSAIEARVLCWLAGQENALEVFRRGEDIYVDMACAVYSCTPAEVDAKRRYLGKQSVLGLGYGMGAPKFKESVEALGATGLPLGFFRRVVDIYRREKYTKVVSFWESLEHTVKDVVRKKDEEGVTVRDKLRIFMRGRFLHIELPSGRLLAYAEPQLLLRAVWLYPAKDSDGEDNTIMIRAKRRDSAPTVKAKQTAIDRKWAICGKPSRRINSVFTYMTARGMGTWTREESYGGKLTENVAQAVARDVLAAALLRADKDAVFWRVLLTVHDELVCEAEPEASLKDFSKLVAENPEWAGDLPTNVEAWQGPRYGKA